MRADDPTTTLGANHGDTRMHARTLLTIAIVRAPVLPRWTGYVAFMAFVGLLIVGDADLGIAAAGVVWLVIGRNLLAEVAAGATPATSRA